MARINRVTRNGRYRVSISGDLSFRDLARLEKACGPALEHAVIPLEIQLAPATTVDEASRLFLSRIANRGARISVH